MGQTSSPHVIYNSTGTGMLDPEAHYSLDAAPDIVLKGAVDTSAGHYELYGLARWFRTIVVNGGGSGGVGGQAHSRVAIGCGGGGCRFCSSKGDEALPCTHLRGRRIF